jgi:hypothetical protein
MTTSEVVAEITGWVGSVVVLVAYGLNSAKKIKSDSLAFQLMNIIGGISLIVYSIFKEAFANTFINAVWVLIGVITIINVFRKRKAKGKSE